MKAPNPRKTGRLALALLLAGGFPLASFAAEPAPTSRPTSRPANVIPVELTGRIIDDVRILGKTQLLPSDLISSVNHQVRSKAGQPFDPTTVEGDYQRIFEMRKFANVEARVEPTATGVIVIFEVSEQPIVKEIRIKGNDELDTEDIQQVINIKVGEAVDSFRIGLAKENIVRLYQSKNLPYIHIETDLDEIKKTGILTFQLIEGPKVRVRRVIFLGNKTFGDGRLKDEVKTKAWFPLFGAGLFDADQLEQDVASVRQFYIDRGFFDVRVGRRVVVSPDTKEVQVEFVVDEGQRYVVEQILFKGNDSLGADKLLENAKLKPGMNYNHDLVKRDIREMVKAYSPLGFIYMPNEITPDPDTLKIREERVFHSESGKVELVYNVSEGKPFRIGRVIIKGNDKTQDKVVLREIRDYSGQLYNSDQLLKAQDRLKATGLYRGVTITPIPPVGAPIDPENTTQVRDLLVEVNENDTAKFAFGAGITSSSGILGQIVYEQKNFDITNIPSDSNELFSRRAFTGAGQTFRVSLEPGTVVNRARIDFIEPYIFDQNFSFGNSIYLSQRWRRDWMEDRIGDRIWFGHRFSDVWSGRLFFRGEQVDISNIQDKEMRAPEILELNHESTITGAGIEFRRDTTDSILRPSKGDVMTFAYERAGALGGDFDFDRFSASYTLYTTVFEDLLDRKTILSFNLDLGYITGEAPFFEKLYAGGMGSVRGFRYRGISPRSGVEEDPIGGNFMFTGTTELTFPIAEDILRGALFVDFGDVEDSFQVGTLRTSIGFGFRLSLPFLSQLPISFDFGFPIIKDDQDDKRIISFSLGTVM